MKVGRFQWFMVGKLAGKTINLPARLQGAWSAATAGRCGQTHSVAGEAKNPDLLESQDDQL